jgi:hypothetical protein
LIPPLTVSLLSNRLLKPRLLLKASALHRQKLKTKLANLNRQMLKMKASVLSMVSLNPAKIFLKHTKSLRKN